MTKWQKIRETHPNSLTAFYEGELDGSFGRREKMIIDALADLICGTDREIAEYIGFDHKSAVQPRITELLKESGLLEEMHYNYVDDVTKKTVRVVRIKPRCDSNQIELFA